jgi:electron transport complex protein RnfA
MGFALVLLVLGGLRERLTMTPLPVAMRGAPSVFVTLGLLALALLGLRGVG